MFFRFLLAAILILNSFTAFASDIVSEVFPLERNGVKLFLERMQPSGNAPEKQILLVHGLTYSSHEFDVNVGDYSLARFLTGNGYAVWLLDIAGYGRSEKVKDGFLPNSDYAAEDIAEAAKLMINTSGQSKIDVLGWSWGTVTGGRFAAKYPDMLRKLVLYAPILAGLADIEVTEPFKIPDWAHAASDFQVKADKTIDYDIVEPLVADTFLSNCWRYDGAGSPNGGRRDLLVSPEKRLIPTSSIKVPTLMILGDKDDYIGVELCMETLGSLPEGSGLEVITGAAHAMMMEKPYYRAFREAVLKFLQN
jgi:pimeloyl-ACP methyl ester carboxylesterase